MKPLYIGIRGLAGSGKDTVGNFLSYVLDNYNLSYKETIENYKSISRSELKNGLMSVLVIAFADQLKHICSNIFGVSIEPFYVGRKDEAWISMDDFTYTETRPSDQLITNALEYHSGERRKGTFMSIREIMVYVGTYVLQRHINRNIFVNLVENAVKRSIKNNSNLNYVIITDVRFEHEFNYIHNKGGIVINVENNRVTRLNDIAENSLDGDFEYDFVVENNGTYNELYRYVYDLVHTEDIFKNIVVELNGRTFDNNNYLRVVSAENKEYLLCTETSIKKMSNEGGVTKMIDPTNGPVIALASPISGTYLVPREIYLDSTMRWRIRVE